MLTAPCLRTCLLCLPVLCLPFAYLGCVEEHGSTSGNSETSADGGAGQPGAMAGGGEGGSTLAGNGAADSGAATQSGAGSGAAGAGAGGKSSSGGAGAVGAGSGGASGKSSSSGAGGRSSSGGAGAAGVAGKPAAGSGGAGQPSSDQDAGPGKRCGTRGGVTCADDEFCNYEPDADCGATDRGGACEMRPEICTLIYAPVCGCDNRTYASECAAHGAGVSVKHQDACSAVECRSAGGRVQTSNGANTPMCGAGEDSWQVGSTTDGALCCVPTQAMGATCGGIAALSCGAGQFCNYESSAGGQGCDGKVADAGGKCQQIPMACTRELREVCGCDHKTYSNACAAHAASASILHDGACTVSDCKAISGRAVAGTGPAPMCASNERAHTHIVNDDGSMAIEGMLCCVSQ